MTEVSFQCNQSPMSKFHQQPIRYKTTFLAYSTSSIGFLYDYPNFSHFFVRQRNSGKPSLRLSRLLNLILYATTDQAIHSFPSGQLITKDRTSSAVNVEKTIQQTSKVGKMSIVLTNTAHIAARG